MKIKIYEAEASIAELITNNSIAYCSKAEKLVVPEGQKLYAAAGTKPIDLELYYPTRSILATTVWNKNDDVFSPLHTWAARHTPVHSPTNIDHDHTKIVGHITDSWVIDAEGKLIEDDTEEKDLPEKFHLCNGALIYKYSREKTLMTRAETLIEEIESGKKFVSMECLFPDFDYAVISPEKGYYVVKREETSAFLTKHLRIYGGSGSYNGNKIGRFLKNMVFSGKGYVDNPANPESIIFDSETEFNFSSASVKDINWFNVEDKTIIGVDINIKQLSLSEDVTENLNMADENKVIEKLEAQIASLTKQLVEADVKAKNDEIESLKAQVAKAAAEVETQKAVAEEFKAQVAVAQEEVTKVKAEVAELTTAKTELEEKVNVAVKNETRATRIAKLIDGGVAKEEAEAKVTKFEALSSEQFDAVAEVIVSAVKPKTEEAVADEVVETTEEVEADLTTAETTEAVAGSVTDTTEDKAEVSAKIRESIGNYLFATQE